MAKSTNTSNKFLALLYNATNWANVADNAGTSPLTDIYVSLHNSTPGSGDNQGTNETAYTNYLRVAVARSTSGFSAPASAATHNAAAITFAQCGVSGDTITHVALGSDSSGAGHVFHYGALSAPLTVTSGVQPQFAISALTITES